MGGRGTAGKEGNGWEGQGMQGWCIVMGGMEIEGFCQ